MRLTDKFYTYAALNLHLDDSYRFDLDSFADSVHYYAAQDSVCYNLLRLVRDRRVSSMWVAKTWVRRYVDFEIDFLRKKDISHTYTCTIEQIREYFNTICPCGYIGMLWMLKTIVQQEADNLLICEDEAGDDND